MVSEEEKSSLDKYFGINGEVKEASKEDRVIEYVTAALSEQYEQLEKEFPYLPRWIIRKGDGFSSPWVIVYRHKDSEVELDELREGDENSLPSELSAFSHNSKPRETAVLRNKLKEASGYGCREILASAYKERYSDVEDGPDIIAVFIYLSEVKEIRTP